MNKDWKVNELTRSSVSSSKLHLRGKQSRERLFDNLLLSLSAQVFTLLKEQFLLIDLLDYRRLCRLV